LPHTSVYSSLFIPPGFKDNLHSPPAFPFFRQKPHTFFFLKGRILRAAPFTWVPRRPPVFRSFQNPLGKPPALEGGLGKAAAGHDSSLDSPRTATLRKYLWLYAPQFSQL
jgi:hypothetical protein